MSKKQKKRPLQISFYDDGYGWILLRLNLPEKIIKISISSAFDPLPDLFNWIEDICVGDLPSEFEIDQEGKIIRVEAMILSKDAKDSFLLRISDPYTEQMLVKSELSKRDFIMTLLNRFESFVNKRKNKEWSGYNLNELPYIELKQYNSND
ncbi:hypothetical protein DESC_110001 [Desulfosarcina cetonica]|nr:hypothetical protein DESC_110001 [Desulfosarcina cetonica]